MKPAIDHIRKALASDGSKAAAVLVAAVKWLGAHRTREEDAGKGGYDPWPEIEAEYAAEEELIEAIDQWKQDND